MRSLFILLGGILFLHCTGNNKPLPEIKGQHPLLQKEVIADGSFKTIHVLVALCDNRYQGIVKVPAKIGNGQDPDQNLYWGCSLGIRSFFKNSKEWTLIKKVKVDSIILERLVFKHKKYKYYLIADAYDGKEIKTCTIDYLNSCGGAKNAIISLQGKNLGLYGNAALLAYIGHDGLMDFRLENNFENTDGKKRDAIILACYSKNYFSTFLQKTKTNPLVWTTGLMCPEAYTLHDALEQYMQNKTAKDIQGAAAKAYAKYQKCSVKAAGNLLVTGF